MLEGIKPHFHFGLLVKNLRKEYNWLTLGQVGRDGLLIKGVSILTVRRETVFKKNWVWVSGGGWCSRQINSRYLQ